MLGEGAVVDDDGGSPTEHRWCTPDESTLDLAEEAARAALDAGACDSEAIDLLIVCTETPEYVTPPTSALLQARLEATRAVTFDVNAGGASFTTGMETAAALLGGQGRYARALVVGVSAMSKYLDVHDARTVPFIADGAGAVLLARSDTSESSGNLLATSLLTVGARSHGLGIFAGGTRTPITSAVLDAGLQNKLRVTSQFVSAISQAQWEQLTLDVLLRGGVAGADVDMLICSQMSAESVSPVMERIGLTGARLHATRTRAGYTGAAGVPMSLHEAAEQSLLRDGDLVLCCEYGAGVSMGAMLVRWRSPSGTR